MAKIHVAAADPTNGYLKVKHLLEVEKVDIDEVNPQNGSRAIHFALQSGSLETIRYLIEAGASMECSESSQNPLFFAGQNCNPGVFEYMTSYCETNLHKFNDGTTQLHAAVLLGDMERTKALVTEEPSQIAVCNNSKVCPFDMALDYGYQSLFYAMTNSVPLDGWDEMYRSSATDALKKAKNSLRENKKLYLPIIHCKESLRCFDLIKEKTSTDLKIILQSHYIMFITLTKREHVTAAAIEFQKIVDLCAKHKINDDSLEKICRHFKEYCDFLLKRKLSIEKAKDLGFEYTDGHCFFESALLHLLKKDPKRYQDYTAQKLHAEISDNIELDQRRYIDRDYRGYLVDEPFIRTFSQLYDIQIVIFDYTQTEPEVFKSKSNQSTLYLSKERDYSGPKILYHLLTPLPNASNPHIQECMERAKTDNYQGNCPKLSDLRSTKALHMKGKFSVKYEPNNRFAPLAEEDDQLSNNP